MFDIIYKQLQTRLANVTEIKHFNLWNGQTKDPSRHHGFARPAVFVEFTQGLAERKVNKFYDLDLVITLHVVSDMMGTTTRAAQGAQQDRALVHLQLLTKIIQELDGWVSDAANLHGTVWTDFQFDSDYDTLVEHLLLFDCQVSMDATKTNYVLMNPRPPIEVDPSLVIEA